MRLTIFTTLFILSMSETFAALKEDAKFIARILGASDTGKTILVNRGRENGIDMDIHAKISDPTGMIARAVVVKVSPTRSVWSVYRIFNKSKIAAQTVATFKVASAVHLTTDESKELGALADKINKKKEEIPKEPQHERKQQRLAAQILRSQKVTSKFDNIDYGNIEEDDIIVENPKLDPDLDWSALNGKKDGENFDKSLDYSTLR